MNAVGKPWQRLKAGRRSPPRHAPSMRADDCGLPALCKPYPLAVKRRWSGPWPIDGSLSGHLGFAAQALLHGG
ncbi:hypothetical protein B2G74_03470 [Burkholderia sp. A27]|nr:hypothetical protein B2G74_03470 [Burkholderia sp. A27]